MFCVIITEIFFYLKLVKFQSEIEGDSYGTKH